MILFQLEDVTASRGDSAVLRGLSADIGDGITALVGPSGAGKSTLLRLLNRLADPDSGEVRYRGTPAREHDVLALRREVVLVPQLPAPFDTTVEENVRYAARLARRDPDVGELLELAGLPESVAARRATGLSVGEQQRVMLARALALEPRVLLLDEPTAALDGRTTAAVEATLAELSHGLGVAMVLVTHDEAQAGRLARRLLRLADGRIAA